MEQFNKPTEEFLGMDGATLWIDGASFLRIWAGDELCPAKLPVAEARKLRDWLNEVIPDSGKRSACEG